MLFIQCTTGTSSYFCSPLCFFFLFLIVSFVFLAVDSDQLSIRKLVLPHGLHGVHFSLNYHLKVIGVKGAGSH